MKTIEQVKQDILDHGFSDIEGRHCIVNIEPRPNYCDRGRFIVKVFTDAGTPALVDSADCFPRYYFGEDAMMSEIKAWMNARSQL